MDVDQRLTRLEADMAQMREEWTVVQQAPLIQARLLNSLRATQLEHSLKLDEHSAKLDEHSAKLDEHSAKLDEHTAKLDEHTAKLDEHTVRLDAITVKLDVLAGGQELIVGMLTTLIDREPGQ
jgi:division protein CdvB (Snf7/Vps24/ESCRT-III family)